MVSRLSMSKRHRPHTRAGLVHAVMVHTTRASNASIATIPRKGAVRQRTLSIVLWTAPHVMTQVGSQSGKTPIPTRGFFKYSCPSALPMHCGPGLPTTCKLPSIVVAATTRKVRCRRSSLRRSSVTTRHAIPEGPCFSGVLSFSATRPQSNQSIIRHLLAAPLLAILFLLAACTLPPPLLPTPPATETATLPSPTLGLPIPTIAPIEPAPSTLAPSPTASPALPTRTATVSAQATIFAKWLSSPHGNTYDLGKGPNTYCSRCHSPQNWDPTSRVDAPPNCVSCKFETDVTVRIAKSNLLVSQADWRNIGCEICHRLENGVASSEIAWFNKASSQYEAVANTTALCDKCHTDTEVLRHRRDLGKAAHMTFQCTECHDAHTTNASCDAAPCHPSLSQAPGHDAAHASVTCAACHDAGGLPVGPDAATKTWITWRTTDLLGRKTTSAYQSHNLQKAVDCNRCHYAENPWKLSDSVKKTP